MKKVIFYSKGEAMDHTDNCRLKLVVFVMAATLLFSCHRGKSSESRKGTIKESINKAVLWVNTHPAHFNDGMFIEISEEIIVFYIIYKHSEDQAKKGECVREIEKRLKLIQSKKDFRVQPQEYTMFLCIAHISKKLGLEGIDFRKTIENQILSDPLLYPPHITTSIWNTVYLERLGYNPSKTLEEILPQSTLSNELHQRLLFQSVKAQFDPMYVDVIAITVYDVTHEIFSLVDFGEIPPPYIIVENEAFFSELFDHIIKWAIAAGHVDVLAEAIMCVKILDLKDIPSMQSGIDFIISRQEKDGSFGVTNPGRPNVYRHGILVSIMALVL